MVSLFMTLIVSNLALSNASLAYANPSFHLCESKKSEISNEPFHVVSNGKLVSLIGRKLKTPVAFKNGFFGNVTLLRGPNDVNQFSFPGVLYISDTRSGKRLVHNHHVISNGKYSAQANGLWVVDIESTGRAKAIGYNNSTCFFNQRFIPHS